MVLRSVTPWLVLPAPGSLRQSTGNVHGETPKTGVARRMVQCRKRTLPAGARLVKGVAAFHCGRS